MGAVELDEFLSTFTNKIDAKGRVSVPADFRAILARRGNGALILGPSARVPALEGGGGDYLADFREKLAALPPFDPAREILRDSFLPLLRTMTIDGDGRIVLPEEFLTRASLAVPGVAVFVGRGASFQIWHPDGWAERQQEALRQAARLLQGGAA